MDDMLLMAARAALLKQAVGPAPEEPSVAGTVTDAAKSRIPFYDAITSVHNAPTWGNVPESSMRGGLTSLATIPGAGAGAKIGGGIGSIAGQALGATAATASDLLRRRSLDGGRSLIRGRIGGRVGRAVGALGAGLVGASLTQDAARRFLGPPSWQRPTPGQVSGNLARPVTPAPPQPGPMAQPSPALSLRGQNARVLGQKAKDILGSWWRRMQQRYRGMTQ